MNNNQSDSITTVSSSNKNEPKLKSILINEKTSNSKYTSSTNKNQLEFKTLTSKFLQDQGYSSFNFVRPADPLLKRTKVPKVKPKLGKLKTYM